MREPSRKAPRRRDVVERRDALLDAALACFCEQGIANTRIEDVRRTANASPSSVYPQFRGLSDLTLALLIRTFENLFSGLATRVAAAPTAKDATRALVEGHLHWVFAHQGEAQVMYQAMSLGFSEDDAAVLAQRKADALAPVALCFMGFMQTGAMPVMSPLELEVLALGATHEACRRWLAGAPLTKAWMLQRLPQLAVDALWTSKTND